MCEPGSLFHSDDGIEADADMGGFCNALKRSFCAGEDLFRVHYANKSQQPRTITLSSPYPGGKFIAIDLTKLSGLTMKKGAWTASVGSQVEFGYKLAKNLTVGCCAGQGLILSTVKGGGTSFLNAGGTVFQRVLGPGEKITIDQAALVAAEDSVDIGVRRAGSVMMMCCGGQGIFVCELTGPGLVIIQSMPVEKAAMVYYKYMPKQGAGPVCPGPRIARRCGRISRRLPHIVCVSVHARCLIRRLGSESTSFWSLPCVGGGAAWVGVSEAVGRCCVLRDVHSVGARRILVAA